MTKTAITMVWLGVGLMLAGAGGCTSDPTAGYTTNSQYPSNIRTVAVPVWARGKEVYRREIEMRLTEAIVKRIELNTPYKVVDKSRADSELRGTLENVSQRVLSYNPDSGLAREMEVTLTVSFTWTDLKSGKVLREKKHSILRQSGTYIPPGPFGEDFYQGSEDAINKLAQRIVEHMASEW